MTSFVGRLLIVVVLGLAVTARADAPAKKPGTATELPKALPRGETPVQPSDMPPFFGMFGSADLIAKVGFRGSVGSFVEYRVEAMTPGTSGEHGLRLAQVGPEVPGARWIEMTTKGMGVEGSGLRLLTRGTGRGNIERLIVQSPGTPPMELPLSGMSAVTPLAGGSAGQSLLSDVKHLGHEKVQVPLGKFETEHWLVAESPRLEIWTTKDDRVPFVGAVKMLTDEGYAYATKAGTDATALIAAPPATPAN